MNYQELARAIRDIKGPMVDVLNKEFSNNPEFVENEFINPWRPIFTYAGLITFNISMPSEATEENVRQSIVKLIEAIKACLKSPAIDPANLEWYTKQGGVRAQLEALQKIVHDFNAEHPIKIKYNDRGGSGSSSGFSGHSENKQPQPHDDGSSNKSSKSSKGNKGNPLSLTKNLMRFRRPLWS